MITQDLLKQLFEYQDGQLVRKVRAGNRHPGETIGSVTQRGYLEAGIKGKSHYVHRLIWIWHNGDPGNNYIDHKDNNKLNNKIENLRLCTQSENLYNSQKTTEKTSSSYKGVSFSKRSNKWVAKTQYQGKYYHLGNFVTEIAAAIAYNNFVIKYHGEFAKLNTISDYSELHLEPPQVKRFSNHKTAFDKLEETFESTKNK